MISLKKQKTNKNMKKTNLDLVLFLWLLAILPFASFCSAQVNGNERWSDQFAIPGISGGTNPTINAIVQDSSGNIYIGGTFSFVGAVPAHNIAKWDGTTWHACGNGVYGSSSGINSLAAIGNNIYACGFFDSAGTIKAPSIAMWNGNAWDSLNSTMGTVPFGGGVQMLNSLKAYKGKLYVGGGYLYVSGIDTFKGIASYDIASGTWSKMGSGTYGVSQVEAAGGNIYVCGNFISIDGKPINNLAKWNIATATWSSVITTATHSFGPSYVKIGAIYADGNNLYVGGSFATINGITTNNISKLDLTTNTFSALGVGLKSPYISVASIAATGSDVFCNNGYDQTVAHWDGTRWLKGGLYFDAHTGVVVNKLYISNNKAYIGGTFIDCFIRDTLFQNTLEHFVSSGICGYDIATKHIFYQHITKAHGLNASPFGGGIQRIASSGTNIYAVGGFTLADNKKANGIAKWDGTSWDTLTSGLSENGGGFDIAADAKYVYVHGTGYNIKFGNLPMVTGKNIGIWDISNKKWTTDTVRANFGSPYAIDSKGLLYGITRNLTNTLGIGYYDPASAKIVSLGTFSGNVNTIAFDDSDNIYIGGTVTQVGGVSVSGLAKYTALTKKWKDLGGGVVSAVNLGYPGNVVAIYISGSKVYLGGGFIYSPSNPGLSLPGIGVYDQKTGKWGQIQGTTGWKSVSAIAGNGRNIYAAGRISYQTFYTTDYIGQLDTAVKKWTSLGSGAGTVNTMVLNGNYLYAAGGGRAAGGKPSYDIFAWDTSNNLPAAPTNLTLVSTHKRPTPGQYNLNWNDNSNNESGFGIERSADAGNTWVLAGKSTSNMPSFNDTGLNPKSALSYRVYAYNGAGKSAYSNIATAGGSGINLLNNSAPNFEIFPNPTHGLINILLTGTYHENNKITIVNMQGITIYNENIALLPGNTVTINIPNLPQGIYFIRSEQDKGVSLQKLVVQ
jgi:hypothetical protein